MLHMFAYLSSMGWPGIYSVYYSQLEGSKDFFSIGWDISCLYRILVRDIEEVIY